MAPIVQTGVEVLRARAAEVPVEEIGTPELQALIQTMIDTMRAAPGVGLAAPQIGVSKRVIVLEDKEILQAMSSDEELTERARVPFGPKVFINPVLSHLGTKTAIFFEGCLSVSGFAGLVERSLSVEVTGLDEHGVAQTWRASGWPARILQHEVDHLEGTLYIDRMKTRSFSTMEHVRERFGGKAIAEVLKALKLETQQK